MSDEVLLPKIYSHITTIVRIATKEALEQILKSKSFKEFESDDDFLSASQAAKFLKIQLTTVYSKVEKGELPHYRSGKRKLLFKKTELELHVDKSKVKSKQEINEEVIDYLNNHKKR